MKKIISFIIIISIITMAVPAGAANSFITLTPYPYSNHVLGEDLVIYGDTDFGIVVLGLFYPTENGYTGDSKYIITLTAKELRRGHVIKTGEKSGHWPEGKWKIKVQNGTVYDEMYINMGEYATYDQNIRVCEYENSALTSMTTYSTRGAQFKNNILSFSLEDGTHIKIFSWNNLAPVNTGNSKIYIAYYQDGYLTNIKTYIGEISSYGYHISLKISDSKNVKLFYWDENLKPKE